MKFKHLIKMNRRFVIEKIHLNTKTVGDTAWSRFMNMEWTTATDGSLLKEMQQIAREHNIQIISYRQDSWSSDKSIITVNGYRDDFLAFVLEVGERLQKYITIEF